MCSINNTVVGGQGKEGVDPRGILKNRGCKCMGGEVEKAEMGIPKVVGVKKIVGTK